MTDIKRLKNRKKELHITFDQLSEKSGIPKNTIYDIFRGVTKNPRIDTMTALEEALELEPGTQSVTADKEKTAQNIAETLSADEAELLDIYRSLIPTMKEQLLSVARVFAGNKEKSVNKFA